jgi:hypothetical protein
MSLFSRFRKTPPPATAKKPSPTVPTDAAAPAIADASAADAARIAAQDEEAVTAAISAGDAQTLARLAIEGASTRIRQRAAEAIEDPDQIRRLIKGARGGNDKNVYKILTRKRDAVLAHEREQEQLHAEISAISAAIERHSRRPFDPLFAPSLEQLENRWNVVASHAASDIAQTTQQAIDRAREVIAQHLREVAAKAARELTAANEAAAAQKQREEQEQAAKLAAAERAQTAEEQRRAQAEKLDAQAQSLRQIGGLLRKAQGALASGSSKTAAGLRRAIEEKLTTAPPLPAHLANQLKQLDAKLEELKDWKSFSVAPKRIELIEQMESLIGATLHPTALAGHIKDLQEQWRTLSKGAAEDADIESEWQRFHEAAQKAFQPCREYFEAQDQIKQENLRQRGELFERLAAFEARQNWEEEPDWRTVITAVREARQMWRQYAPVDLAQGEELQTRFNELTASLQSRIDAEYARNVKQKNSLIERARASLSLDSRAAIDEVKRLQEIWKSIGPVPRDQDRTLWENFREQCDAVFQKRQQELATQNAQFETSRSQAIALCEELEKIASLSDRELLEAAKKLPELRVAFDAIEDLPRAQARQLQDRFERAFERCRKAVTQQQAQEAERGWIDLLDAANLVRAYRLAVAQQENTAELEALKQSAEERLANAVQSPKRGVEVLKTSLAQQGSNDLPANELALRTLCVRAEILTDTPSPADDQALRRELQVKRLMQSMGQGVKADAGELDTMMIEWLGVGPIEESTYLTLADRFKECRRRALASRSRS